MLLRFLLWNLADTATSVADLRAEPIPQSRGAVSETWFSDEVTDRFGAFAVFRDEDAAGEPVHERLLELIGRAPDVVELFTVEE